MATTETEWQDCFGGKLIALEGDSNILATQLRLLPPSKKFLILPSTTEVVADKHEFDARSYIREVHFGSMERTERARSFLQGSTSEHPRLAFMNGGSVSARTTCIARICDNVTNGDVEEAQSIFNEIVKYGVAGLMKDRSENHMRPEKDGTDCDGKGVKEREFLNIRVLDAADSLKRENAVLQSDASGGLVDSPSQTSAIDGTQSTKGTPVHRKEIFTTEHHGDEIIRTELEILSWRGKLLGRRGTFGSQYEIVDYNPYTDIASPGADSLKSVPPKLAVAYGEACLVGMGSVSPKELKRAQSIDRLYPSRPCFPEPLSSPRPLKKITSACHLRMRPTTSEGFQLGHDGFSRHPRTTSVNASETTIRKSSRSAGSFVSSSSSLEVSAPPVFVNLGTDANPTEDFGKIEVAGTVKDAGLQSEYFIPVFPVVEDFILQLLDGKPNEILESVIRSLKAESYPVIPSSTLSSPFSDNFDSPVSPQSAPNLQHSSMLRPSSHLTEEMYDVSNTRGHEFDPYYSHDDYQPDVKRQWPQDKHSGANNGPSTVAALKSTVTPPPSNGIAGKFVYFSPVNAGNAINVQNSLRQLLSSIFPAGQYSQYCYPVAPEANRLWKPVFRNEECSSIGNEEMNVDQILALGCEEGVKRDFFFQISGQVEKLGTNRDGTSRSGKLDIGYLIAQVMQGSSSVSYPSAVTSGQNSNPTLLADLLVPQIEAFLASNINTKFLILHYPSSHLATVFALRKLLGSDIFKIAGVLDSLVSDLPSTSRSRAPFSGNPLSNEAVVARNGTRCTKRCKDSLTTLQCTPSFGSSIRSAIGAKFKTDSGASFAKVDFLLPSTATDAEITTLLSEIRKSLTERSPFYIPESESNPAVAERPPTQPPTPSSSSSGTVDAQEARNLDSGYPASTCRSTASKTAGLTGNTGAGSRINYEPSIASTTRHKYVPSTASNRTVGTERGSRRAEKEAEKEWENFYVGEDDSEDDAYDRMILGRALAKIIPEVSAEPMRNKKKALEWLGLA